MSQTPEQALREYESATNSHDFNLVKPLLAENAIYFFSDGTHQGWREIRQAFEDNWNTIRDEHYRITDVKWLTVTDKSASCIYLFHWEGWFKDQWRKGSGRGTNIFRRHHNRWLIVHEHLSPLPER